jgi:Domain of unknown function (DUF4113)
MRLGVAFRTGAQRSRSSDRLESLPLTSESYRATSARQVAPLLVELQSETQEQRSLDLFNEPEPVQPDSRRDLMQTIDALNERFGHDSVGVASASRKAPRSAHASRQERRSPRYTTRLGEIVTARAYGLGWRLAP